MKDDNHWRSLYFIKNKSETLRCLEDFFKKTNKHLEKEINIFRSDNGLDFNKIEELTHRYGITHQKIIPFISKQNCSAERKNRIVVDLARTSLYTEKLLIKI